MNIIIKKWVEPYVLLETLKNNFKMKDFTFNGHSKLEQQQEFLSEIKNNYNFGLYMKNVNKFYLFYSQTKINFLDLLKLNNNDIEYTNDIDKPFNMVDLGKAEAGIIKFY